MRSVENAGCGKCGVWKMRGVENAGCVSLCHSNVDKQCVNDKNKNKNKKTRCIIAF